MWYKKFEKEKEFLNLIHYFIFINGYITNNEATKISNKFPEIVRRYFNKLVELKILKF
ncbi:hypothetical protein [Pseudostreptobacillus hongkongensis]|uniref:hypothetical protein n=1 Tax=Pseudostreptobacillus hongkongensis TaxID=1162717 RepID=UPI0039E818D2